MSPGEELAPRTRTFRLAIVVAVNNFRLIIDIRTDSTRYLRRTVTFKASVRSTSRILGKLTIVERGRYALSWVRPGARTAMTAKKRTPETTSDAEIEREARAQVRYSLADAIGRAGADLLKGASPVTRRRQAELEIEQFLEQNLDDAEGALSVVLPRRARDSETLLADSYENPLKALSRFVGTLLSSQRLLRGFVHEVDAEWGRIYLERPFFEKEGQTPHSDDPYTVASVRKSLEGLLERLERGASASSDIP